MEIEQSFANLEIIPEYLRRFPFGRSKISKVNYLRYHVENHLQELYILRNRIEAFLTLLTRYYRKEKDYPEIEKAVKIIRELLTLSFDGLTKLRGHHTHQKRFADDDLIRLSFLDIVSHKKTLGFLFEGSYRNVRKSKLQWIKRNNQLVKRVLDGCFQYLTLLLFDRAGEIRYPRHLSK